ncbi:MAG TPA: 4-hydroxy-tetrahydrodipicolinate reductase [Burkholderiales bacterium]|nr:4-hydroxy-tetrahydrodipicolinate reductase [Burkholderiales bacterium]
MAPLRVVIAGSAGRMGRTLIEAVLADEALALSAALEQQGHPALGREAAEGTGRASALRITDDVSAALEASDVLIDFTRPQGTLAHLERCAALGKPMVVGTTGFSADDQQQIARAAERIPLVIAPNMAVGVNVVFKLAEVAARALGEGYDVEIIEAHHRHKVDAPSGTALRLGELVAAALGRDLASCAVHGRHGDTGERDARSIGFHALRGGDIVGEHTVMFAGSGERVELTVRSASRMTYALGALRAAKFLRGRAPGRYDMFDVLGIK